MQSIRVRERHSTMRRRQSVAAVCALESRQLLAGNVTLSFTGGTLKLTGDNSANEVTVSQSVGGLQIQALNGTKLNGVVNGTQTIANPTLTEINLQGGNDKLSMNGYVGGIVAALMGSGNDVVRMTSVVNEGSILFDLGSGNDFWTTFGSLATPNQVGGNLTVRGNSGNDSIGLQRVLAAGNLTLTGDNGVDQVAVFDSIVDGTSSIDLGNGNDFMLLLRSRFTGTASILGNTGNDVLGSQSGDFRAATTFDLGNGNDSLLMDQNLFAANLSRIGGNGTDLAYQFNDTVGGASTNSGFETLLTSLTPQADTLYTQLFQRFD